MNFDIEFDRKDMLDSLATASNKIERMRSAAHVLEAWGFNPVRVYRNENKKIVIFAKGLEPSNSYNHLDQGKYDPVVLQMMVNHYFRGQNAIIRYPAKDEIRIEEK